MSETKSNTMALFGERLGVLLKETKTSYRELAGEIGCSYQTIYYALRNAHRSIGCDIAIGIARYFGVSVDWLFGLTNERNGQNQSGNQGIVVVSDLDAGQIAMTMLDKVKTDELCLTISIDPDRTEIQVRPWGGASYAGGD